MDYHASYASHSLCYYYNHFFVINFNKFASLCLQGEKRKT